MLVVLSVSCVQFSENFNWKLSCFPQLKGIEDIVGWRTSSIRRNSQLPKVFLLFSLQLPWEDSLSEKYPHVVYEEYSAGSRNDKCTDDSLLNDDSDLLEGKYHHFI
ncbi:hypothetical protein BHM03_00057928 [Ensete ventricosum]|nr:hypothetical protein BHM03_00057928 [Ensete ventricosum]